MHHGVVIAYRWSRSITKRARCWAEVKSRATSRSSWPKWTRQLKAIWPLVSKFKAIRLWRSSEKDSLMNTTVRDEKPKVRYIAIMPNHCRSKISITTFFLDFSIDIVEYLVKEASNSWKPPVSHVKVLTNDNFTDWVENHELSLVEFYSPGYYETFINNIYQQLWFHFNFRFWKEKIILIRFKADLDPNKLSVKSNIHTNIYAYSKILKIFTPQKLKKLVLTLHFK